MLDFCLIWCICFVIGVSCDLLFGKTPFWVYFSPSSLGRFGNNFRERTLVLLTHGRLVLIGIVFASILAFLERFFPKTSQNNSLFVGSFFFVRRVLFSFFILPLSFSLALLSLLCLSGPELPVKPLKVFIPAQSINSIKLEALLL